MTTATRSTTGLGTLVVCAVVGALAVGIMMNRGKGEGVPAREDKEDNLILEIHFKPYPRATDSLHVMATAEGVPIHNDFPEVSPWIKPEWVPKGTKVVLSAWQTSQGTLQCIIRHKGRTVAEDYTEVAGGGMESRVTCTYRNVG